MFNVQQITSRLSMMSDEQLAQYARLHKDDPYILPLASAEAKRRQQDRLAAAGRQAAQAGQKSTIADQNIAAMQLPEDQGIGVLPETSLATMADGGIAGYAEGKNVFDPDKYLTNPNVQKFLAYINTYEGNPKANDLVGFKKFASLEDHPRQAVKFNKKGDKSTAAGMYQLLGKTWDEQKKKMGLEDFSPQNQQRAAIGVLKQTGALDAIVRGDFDTAKEKAKKAWASLPGSTIGAKTGQKAQFKPQAEAMLQDRPVVATKEGKATPLSKRIFDMLPMSEAGAADVVPRADDLKARVAAARAAHKERFGTDMPITSEARTRAEQQKLYDDWKKGKPGIYRPINPADYPGRQTFHEDAVDISRKVPESFLKEFGLHRPIKGDPVHAVAMRDWQPPAMAKAEPKAEPKVVAQRLPEPKRDTSGLPSLISSAQAGEVPRKTKQAYVEGMAGPASTGMAGIPLSEESKRLMAGKPAVAPTVDETVYTPEGTPLIAPPGGPESKSPFAAQLAGVIDIPAGALAAPYSVMKTNFFNLPFGKHYTWEEAQAAGNDNYLQYLRLGKSLGLENDPAYRKDPFNYLLQLPSMGVEKIAEGLGVNKAAAQTVLDNALVALPFLKGVKPVQYNVPKLPGKGEPKPMAEAAKAVDEAKAAVEAAEAKVAAPRLPESIPSTATEVSSSGIATLPSTAEAATAATKQAAGMRGAAVDKLALDAARKRLEEAQTIAAASSKVPGKSLLDRFNTLPFASRAVVPAAILSSTTGGGLGEGAETPEGPPVSDTYPDEMLRGIKPKPDAEAAPTITPDKLEAAKAAAEEIAPKTGGLSNEDILTMGLNMLMAQPGQPGGELSQLFSNVGRSGIATLGARREREKLEQERAYKDIYSKYLKAQTEQFGREPEEVRTIRALDKDPGLFDRYLQMKGASVKSALVRSWTERSKDPLLGPEFLKQYPTVESYLASSGYGNVDIGPRAAEALKLYP